MRALYSILLLDAGKANRSAYLTTITSEVVCMISAALIEVVKDPATCRIHGRSYGVGSSSRVVSYLFVVRSSRMVHSTTKSVKACDLISK